MLTGAHLRQRAHQLTLLTTGQAEAPPQQALRLEGFAQVPQLLEPLAALLQDMGGMTADALGRQG